MDVKQLLANPPKLHCFEGQLTSDWKLADEELLLLDQLLTSEMKTIETGAGLSTIIFALKGTEHTCIVPNPEEVQRIQAYCNEQNISCNRIQFITELSESVLPFLKEKDFNLALIDGRHAFPTPFIDWYYIANLLTVGGIVIIDDLHIWTCEVLAEFLVSDDNWELMRESLGAATFIKKGNSPHNKNWLNQPFVTSQSRHGTLSGKVRYLFSLLKRQNYALFWNTLLLGIRSGLSGNFGQRNR